LPHRIPVHPTRILRSRVCPARTISTVSTRPHTPNLVPLPFPLAYQLLSGHYYYWYFLYKPERVVQCASQYDAFAPVLPFLQQLLFLISIPSHHLFVLIPISPLLPAAPPMVVNATWPVLSTLHLYSSLLPSPHLPCYSGVPCTLGSCELHHPPVPVFTPVFLAGAPPPRLDSAHSRS